MKKRVLIVVANPSTHPTLQYPVGFWASELFHPIEVFNEENIEWAICSPNGGNVVMDAMSDPYDESQYSSWDELSKKYVDNMGFMKKLEDTPSIASMSSDEYDAIMVAGGQSPMFTFKDAAGLHQKFVEFYERGKVTAAICHGVALLNYAKNNDGTYLVTGKQVTGFTNEEEDQANASLDTEIMPWRIEDELTKKGADFVKSEAWQPFVVVDGNLITGQQNMSGEVTALEITKLLK